MSSLRSPKRRKILASINPPDNHQNDSDVGFCRDDGRDSDASSAPPTDETRFRPANPTPSDTKHTGPRVTKFRFKSSSSRSHHRFDSRHSRRRDRDEDDASESRRRHRRHHHRSRSRSRSRPPCPSGSASRGRHNDEDHQDQHDMEQKHRHRHQRRRPRSRSPKAKKEKNLSTEKEPADPFSPAPLSPDTAFRESLFDAMADDEGAAYWEAVYGQPIHIYSLASNGPQGELERMTDEEYAAYVRQKMWEKTHAGLVEERARREREREEWKKRENEAKMLAEEMERSLRRGEERRRRREWRGAWEEYLGRWDTWDGGVMGIPWPTRERSSNEGMDEDSIKTFFVDGLGSEELGESEFAARLKEERVRWHPDKMQQRLGGQGQADAAVMKKVTAIFQVIDCLWNVARKSS